MIITKIIRIRSLQPIIPLAPLPLRILPAHQQIYDGAANTTDPQHAQTDAVTGGIPRRLGLKEDVGGDDTTDVSHTDLERGGHTALVVAGNEVGHPAQDDGLRDVSSGNNEEEGKVLYTAGEVVLGEQDDIPHGRNTQARDAEEIAMLHTIRDPSRAQGQHRRHNEDRNTPNLRHGRSVSKLLDDGGREEGACVARVDDAEVGEGAEVDFGVAHDAAEGDFVHAVHAGFAGVVAEAGDEHGALGFGEEGCGFGPVGDPPLRHEADDDGQEAFEDEDPGCELGPVM